MRDIVETYFRDLSDIRSTGAATKETSYYAPLAALLNALGDRLTPRVRAVFQLSNRGSGIPDGGLFSAEQLRVPGFEEAPLAQMPARGALEVKGPGDDAEVVAKSQQVLGYVDLYGQVLVTNYRDFLLVERDHERNVRESERITLAASEGEFWERVKTPRVFADQIGDQLAEYLHRVMVRQVSLTQPHDVALLLASYARDMRTRLEQRHLEELDPLRISLEEALGLTFAGESGAHFFRSTVVQTLFYGMFSAWVLDNRGAGRSARRGDFNWRLAGWSLKVPAIQALFHEFASPDAVGRLGVEEVLDWTGEMLNRIEPVQFFSRFSEEHAVQYFYEPFLEAFDPELRKQLGVWYTPPEVVTYMVERVDTVLREELGIARGLADPNVYVLDPCTGTGSYLVAVLQRIHRTLEDGGADALTANDLKEAAKTRLFGFELLPAPFVVAHLQIGLALQQLGAPLQGGASERPAIFLTNALTGWDAISNDQYTQRRAYQLLADLENERNAAGEIKREKPILVVLGNPPYNGYASIGVDEERDLSNAYRTSNQTKQPQGQGLNDLYVRFFRMAERRIVEQTGKGIVCYISNYSWLDGLSFPAMRERYLDVFDQIWIDNLNGDKYKTGKLTPEGRPDPSVFSTEWNREGIQVGTAIALMVRRDRHRESSTIRYRSLWGVTKRQHLLDSLGSGLEAEYESVEPSWELGLPFVPAIQHPRYLQWPLLPELFPVSYPGVKTARDPLVVDIDRERLVTKMEQYFNRTITDAQMARIVPSALASTKSIDAKEVRKYLVNRGVRPEGYMRYLYKPFDLRWLYWESETKLLDGKREEYVPQVFADNIWIEARQRSSKEGFDRGVVTRVLADNLGNGMSSWFPLLLCRAGGIQTSSLGNSRKQFNLSPAAESYIYEVDAERDAVFYHALVVMHAPTYRVENAGALRQDWPRIPLPADGSLLSSSAELGRQLAGLLDVEQDVVGASSGRIRHELRTIGVLTKIGDGGINPDTDDLAVTVGWGRGGNGKPVMPGRGRVVERALTAAEAGSIRTSSDPLGLGTHDPLGSRTIDVYLNDDVFWQNIPERVWEYSLGGYQVLKKWLSYRETVVLGRNLKVDEVRLFTQIARRIAAIILMEPELDANYRRCTAETWDWQAAIARTNQPRLWTDD